MALRLFNEFRPSRLLDQHFGLGLTDEDLLEPFDIIPSYVNNFLRGTGYHRPWRVAAQDIGSNVQYDKDKFQVNLDVQHFAPEEITVKTTEDSIVVEGKHEEKPDEHGYISRQFVRRYALPKEYDLQGAQSRLSSDGVLTITAPKSGAIESQERVIPITHTGPHKAIKGGESKKTGK